MSVERQVCEELDRLWKLCGGGAGLGVAVSGGGDSTALLLIARVWAADRGVSLHAASVDHGLRPEAAEEVARVGALCASHAIPHDTLKWDGWSGTGNLQDAARRARYGLLAGWAAERGIGAVALGHTMDDQAETVLMRLGRGAGVDGLSAMAPVRLRQGIHWLRPMLGIRREALRRYLSEKGVGWSEDPSNEELRYERVRMRRALRHLEASGITVEGLARTASRMRAARRVLEQAMQQAAREIATVRLGSVVIGRAALGGLEAETRRRLLVHALNWVSGHEYPPRSRPLEDAEKAIGAGKTASLHGCLVVSFRGLVVICREAGAVAKLHAAPGEIWDGRWLVTGPHREGARIAALGEAGLAECSGWRDLGLPREALMALPAVWKGADLVAAPLLEPSPEWQARLVSGEDDFFTSALSH